MGRYVIHDVIATGGMASVHLGSIVGDSQFSRTVAIKRLHPQYAQDPEFVAMFLDEARLASRIRSPHVVPVLDVVSEAGQLLLVMEYVHGATVSHLLRATSHAQAPVPQRIASAIVIGMLTGLHAAHEAKDEKGQALQLVHRDVSPQNAMVGVDGVVRVVDFGVAKAVSRSRTTTDGRVRGKFAYMAPEQMRGDEVTRTADIYSAAVMLWELLAGRRLHDADNEAAIIQQVMAKKPPRPSAFADVSPTLDGLVMRGLAKDPRQRFATAREMALALEELLPPATPGELGAWAANLMADDLARREALITHIESGRYAVSQLVSAAEAPSDGTISSASLSRSRTSNPVRRGAPWLGLAAAVLSLGAFALWLASSRPPASGAKSIAAAPAAGEPPQQAAAAPSVKEDRAPGLNEPSSITPQLLAPVASSSAAAKQHQTAAARPAAVRKVASAPAGKSKICDPPYTLDTLGHKHFKLYCL